MNETTSILKQQIRQQTRLLRQNLTAEELLLADSQVALIFQQYFIKKQFNQVALYLQHDSELGTAHIIELLFQMECKIYLPKIIDGPENQMQFIHYHQNSIMTNNRFGILEPKVGDVINIANLDLILMPLTAFDMQGNRLGMGGGFYDRALSIILDNKPVFAGIAYDFQQVESCPVESFDQKLKMIFTPTRVIDFTQ